MAKQQINKLQINPTARQTGWDYINITTAGATQTKSVTFPTAFASAPTVNVTPYGYTTGTVTGPDSFTGSYASSFALHAHVVGITQYGFTIILTSNPGTFGVSKTGFGWTADA